MIYIRLLHFSVYSIFIIPGTKILNYFVHCVSLKLFKTEKSIVARGCNFLIECLNLHSY